MCLGVEVFFKKVLLLVSLDSGNKKIWNRVFTLAIPDFVLFTMLEKLFLITVKLLIDTYVESLYSF